MPLPLTPYAIEKLDPEIYITLNDVVAAVAYWGVWQSPYPIPDNFLLVLTKLHEKGWQTFFRESQSEMFMGMRTTRMEIFREWFTETMYAIPEFVAWKNSKFGKCLPDEISFPWENEPDPDYLCVELNSFIDAVIHNIFIDAVHQDIRDRRIAERIAHEINMTIQGTDEISESMM